MSISKAEVYTSAFLFLIYFVCQLISSTLFAFHFFKFFQIQK